MDRSSEARRALAAIEGGATPGELESQTLEFKEHERSTSDTVRHVVDAVLCLANSEGGVVVVGVADKRPGKDALTGTRLEREQLRRSIYDLSRPPLVVDIDEEVILGARLLLVYVPRSIDIHSDTQGRAPRRLDRACVPMDPAQQVRLREERRGVDLSAQPTGRSIADASKRALQAARDHLRALTGERRRIATASDEDLLRALGVLTEQASLNRAGEILFCESGPGTRAAIVYQHRVTQGGEPLTVERLHHPLLLAFGRAMELVQARRNMAPVTLPDGQQLQIEDFPELAVREALANAVIHGDYHLAEPVHVEHSSEVFKIVSPGPLVSGVTPQNILTHPSKPRNPTLAQAARTLGLAEEVGRGVDRMYREMIRSGRDLPRIESNADSVAVVLVGGAPKTSLARFVAQLPAHERDDTDTLLVLLRLCSVHTVRADDIAPRLQKSAEEAEAVLRRLATDTVDIIEPTRETARRAHPSYRLRASVVSVLGTAVTYRRRTVDDIDRKVIAHVREYGTITNRTVQNLLDVALQRARGILADLVARGVLVKVSDHERGPGVEYGPGKKFPQPERRRRGVNGVRRGRRTRS